MGKRNRRIRLEMRIDTKGRDIQKIISRIRDGASSLPFVKSIDAEVVE